MKRIIVIGCPGSGKSTFAKALHSITHIPLFHLDMMYWQEDKTIVDKAVFLDRLSSAMQLDEWIIDGNYSSTMEMRLSACDTVFFLDYPVEVCLDGIVARVGKPRTDMPWVESEVDAEFEAFVRQYRDISRPKVLALLDMYASKNIYIFQNRQEADDFLKNHIE